ncbi:MAG: hypothetical protein LUF35_14465 [Lachnospiraceae bacterium]|nr:hypothetical protein [Lachnospiraceae bacterium]
MKRKFLSTLLCLTMTAGMLTGCGSSSDKEATETAQATVGQSEEAEGSESAVAEESESTNAEESESVDAEDTDAEENESTDAEESSAQEEEEEEYSLDGEPTVIKWGHNWIQEMDTTYVDPVTGEPVMGAEEMEARLYAEQQVLEKYNCVIEFVQYPSDLTECILQSVLAGDPIADIVRLTNGTQGQVLAQNVLQTLDDYAYLFEDEDDAWIYWGEVYGHNYFLNNVMRFGSNELLCYNITMIEQVDALKVDGKTKYPADYFVEGTWTWSVFEDYLQKIDDYWKQQWEGYHAYQTDYRSASLQAIYSNGGEVYGDSGLGIASDETKEAVSFIDRLIQKDLLYSESLSNDDPSDDAEIDGYMDTWRFQWGHTVFTNLPQWLAGDMVEQFADRGEAMGVVPFPRPDSMEADDPNYRQVNDATDCYAIPKGLSEERTELVIKVFKEYTQSYYKKLADSDKAMDYYYSESSAMNVAISLNLDVTNEEYGENILTAFRYLVDGDNALVNEYSKNAGIYEYWSHDILGYSLFGVNGASSYEVQVEAEAGVIDDLMVSYEAILSGTEVNDNVEPTFEQVDSDTLIFAAGTDPAGVDWTVYMTASDNIDGDLDMADASVDYSEIDFDTVGSYDGKLVYTISDASGNEGEATLNVIIYNADNTTAPTLVIKEEYRTVSVDENASDISWKDDFVEEATDADGLDISGNLVADLSELDTTTPGEYNVEITLTDYAGNETKETIAVTVE